jgi:hypothetical protein
MATMTETPETTDKETRLPSHEFHAEAHVLSGELKRPVEQKIEPHVPVTLKGRRSGHLYRFTEDVSIEGLITFKSGHTRVSGTKSLKNDPDNHGWVTVATSILEGLNVFEVVTADRIVSQIATDHPINNSHIQHVAFLGTHFDNLRVNGIPLTIKLNFGMCGQKPKGDQSYLTDPGFLNRAKEQAERVAQAGGLPKDLQTEYADRLTIIHKLIKGGTERPREPKLTCSIVQSIDNLDKVPIPGIRAIGHVLIIPDFGTVSLGELEVHEVLYGEPKTKVSNTFELMMFKMKLGCIGEATANGGGTKANGQSYP